MHRSTTGSMHGMGSRPTPILETSSPHTYATASAKRSRRQAPDSGTTVYYRDARGLVTQSSDGRGVVTNFTYDNAGRMLTRKPVGALSENIVYTWDQIGGGNKGKGRLTKIVDESGTTSWKYNALGQIITDTRVVGANT